MFKRGANMSEQTKEDAKKILADVSQDQAFNFSKGSCAKNLEELYSELISMNNDEFSHHVNEERNDFSNCHVQYIFHRDDSKFPAQFFHHSENCQNRIDYSRHRF